MRYQRSCCCLVLRVIVSPRCWTFSRWCIHCSKITLRVPLPTANLLHHSCTSSDCTITPEHIYHHVSSAHWVILAANQQGRVCGFLPLGLIYCPVLGCYCTDLLLRPGVNCPALGSISNRTARDMGPDTSKRWHYIIPRCSGKWSLQTPPYKSLIIQKKEAGDARPALPGNVISSQHTGRDPAHLSWQNTLPPQLLLEDQWVCGVVSGHFLPE